MVDVGDSLLSRGTARQKQLAPANRATAQVMLQAMGSIGTDALVPGENELALGLAWLKKHARQARVPLLAANLLNRRGRPVFAGHRVVQRGGVKVGLLGVVDLSQVEPAIKPWIKRARVRTTDPVVATRAGVNALLKAGAEVVLVLAHMGLEQARQVARVPGVHLVLLGHHGARLNPPQQEGKVYLLEAGRRGRELGHVELRLGQGWTAASQLVDDSARFTLYAEAAAADQELRKLLGAHRAGKLKSPPQMQMERALQLRKRFLALPVVASPHVLIGDLVELNDKIKDHPEIKAVVASRQRLVPDSNHKPKKLHMIPIKIR